MSKIKVSSKTILDIAPYVPGQSDIAGQKKIIKLASNENPFGCSEAVKAAIADSFSKLHRYPDGGVSKLREKIGATYGINPAKIVCGAGSDEIITLICIAYAGTGDEVVYTEHGFLMYPISAMSTGATPVKALEKGLKADVDEILRVVTPKTKIVFLANPNNPTGSYLTTEEVEYLRRKLREDILLVLDYAYAEFIEKAESPKKDYPNAIELVDKFDNVLMMRTFSKVYGIPSVRLGWSYASAEVTDILNRVRGPFNVSSLAQIAGVAALEDQAFVIKTVRHNNKWLETCTNAINLMGFKVYPSVGNFILVDFASEKRANEVDEFLKKRAIIIRPMKAYGLPSCLRISIGLDEENMALLAALEEYKSSKI
jgi:histidinol-phosphate aminotransferase